MLRSRAILGLLTDLRLRVCLAPTADATGGSSDFVL